MKTVTSCSRRTLICIICWLSRFLIPHSSFIVHHSSAPLQHAYQHGKIGAAFTGAHQRVQLLLDRGGRRQRQACILRELEHDGEILVIQTGIDAGAEVTPHHAFAEELEHAARSYPTEHCLAYARRFEAALPRERERFSNALGRHSQCQLIARLGCLPGAVAAHVQYGPAQAREERLHTLEYLRLPA